MGHRQKNVFPWVIALITHLIFVSVASAVQAPDSPLGESRSEAERKTLAVLALADAPMRDAILDASRYPDVIDQVAQIREASSREFRSRLDPLPRSKQGALWELVRYRELVDELIFVGRPVPEAIGEIVAPYPERVREIARGLTPDDFDLLVEIANLMAQAERQTASVLIRLPLETQASFEMLIERPDLLAAMVNQPLLVERLARMSRADLQRARAAFTKQHEIQLAADRNEIDSWRQTIDNNPEVRTQLVESAEQFAQDQGYRSPRETVVERTEVHHYRHPYPWWFGPPSWRIGLHWYPHHLHWGFQLFAGGGVYINALPTAAFSYWHHRRPHQRRHHRHLHRHWARYRPKHHLERNRPHSRHQRFRRSHPRSYERRTSPRSRRHAKPRSRFFHHAAPQREGTQVRNGSRNRDRHASHRPRHSNRSRSSSVARRLHEPRHEKTATKHVRKSRAARHLVKAAMRGKKKAAKAKRRHRSVERSRRSARR